MAYDGIFLDKSETLLYQCPNKSCGLAYDGYNCVNCSFKNESGYPGELVDNGGDALYGYIINEVKATVRSVLGQEGEKEGTLQIELSDPWFPQIVYIEYKIDTIDNKRQLADELEIIKSIDFSIRDGTSKFLEEMLDVSGIDIENEIRKVFYGDN